MAYTLYHSDCFIWLDEQPEASFEAIVTDPPYGLKEYSAKEQAKLRNGPPHPPSFQVGVRQPQRGLYGVRTFVILMCMDVQQTKQVIYK